MIRMLRSKVSLGGFASLCLFSMWHVPTRTSASESTIRTLTLKSEGTLPVGAIVSPGVYDFVSSGPFAKGPSAFGVAANGDAFTAYTDDVGCAIVQTRHANDTKSIYRPTIPGIPDSSLRVRAISCAGKWIFASIGPGIHVGVWEIGKPESFSLLKTPLAPDDADGDVIIEGLWGQESGAAVVNISVDSKEALYIVNQSVDPKLILTPANGSKKDENNTLITSQFDTYVCSSNYASNASEWTLYRKTANETEFNKHTFSFPQYYHCICVLPLGVDLKQNLYVLMDAWSFEKDREKLIWRVIKIRPNGDTVDTADLPIISRAYVSSLNYVVGPSGGLYLMYTQRPVVKKGDPIVYEIGRFDF